MYLAEVCFETNDVVGLSNFYRKLLQLEEENMDEVHQCIIGDQVGITVYNDGSVKNNHNNNITLAFTVEDVDAEYKRLLEMDIKIIEPPTTRLWGARNMHFCDPDGNHIYFRSFPK